MKLKEQQECGICMGEFEQNQALIALGCSKGDTKHIFHKACVDKMMNFNKQKQPPQQSKCPYCKANVLPGRFMNFNFKGFENKLEI